MPNETEATGSSESTPAGNPMPWKHAVALYTQPSLASSVGQLLNSVLPYLALWGLMIWAYQYSYWLTVPLAALAAGFLVRIFIIFHDCTHGSFFRSRRANEFWGYLTGVLTLTPFHQWRRMHAVHHGTSGDLDRRGFGDIWTLTVQEYLEATRWKRFSYRLARNPFVLFVFAPMWLFLIEHRIPSKRVGKREARRVHLTNLGLLVIAVTLCLTVGWQAYLAIQLTVQLVAGASGVWLFYVQHQFEGVYWERQEDWDFVDAALLGSSFYKLPRILQWFSGNIGYHHLHHLSPAIPNYNLERCHNGDPMFSKVPPVTLWPSFKALTFRFWDEKQRKLVGNREMRIIRRALRHGLPLS